MESNIHRPTWKTLLAFAIIYFVWGSTFLAIRVGVREVPPLLLAAMRFSVAGARSLWLDDRTRRALTERPPMGVGILTRHRVSSSSTTACCSGPSSVCLPALPQ